MRNWILLFLLFVIAGCATAALPRGPDTFALADHPNAHRVGVVKVIDTRDKEGIGTIGGLGVKAKKDDMVDLTTNYLIHTLNRELSLNVVLIEELGESKPEDVIARHSVDRLLVVKVYNMRLFSFDALLHPARMTMDLEVTLYDQAGKVLFSTFVKGEHERWFGLNVSDANLGRLVDEVTKNAVYNIFYTVKLKDLL